jgi:hypothetical protein
MQLRRVCFRQPLTQRRDADRTYMGTKAKAGDVQDGPSLPAFCVPI